MYIYTYHQHRPSQSLHSSSPLCDGILLFLRGICFIYLAGGKKRKKAQISARAAVRALLMLSFLPKTAIVPVFETESSYP